MSKGSRTYINNTYSRNVKGVIYIKSYMYTHNVTITNKQELHVQVHVYSNNYVCMSKASH